MKKTSVIPIPVNKALKTLGQNVKEVRIKRRLLIHLNKYKKSFGEGYSNPVEYFKSPIVQEFLDRVDNKTFAKVVYKIAKYPGGNFRGTPDYIVWNKKELIFVEVKREKEKLSEDQITWAKFLIQNKIPYKIVRVVSK